MIAKKAQAEKSRKEFLANSQRLDMAIRALHLADIGLSALLENEEYIECRQDEDCDHCLAKQSQAEVKKTLKELGHAL